ncbi:esterase/lipase family protein [Streptomyces sp. NPDC058486]|uniref:esterase/lipase family protein n=1 Tax=unclassified Streptomyces TaxID=2593676 RepID=UPI00365EB758
MGSELYDAAQDKVIWGLADSGWLTRAWLTPTGLTSLGLTEEEREGRRGRVQARRLLQVPAWSPFLRGIEPYHRLLRTIEEHVAHRDAVMTFPYDWRLPVAAHAKDLARAAREHLVRWRNHPAHTAARRDAVDEREARLVFIAHSMGGLVAYAALTLGGDSDLADDTRGVMTLGTPFHGSAVATDILNARQGAPLPLPHTRLSRAAATMPGVHDLLPRFLCLEDGADVRRLSPVDIADLGGDKELFDASRAFFGRLYDRPPLSCLRPVVGIRQATVQSLRLSSGLVRTSEYGFRTDTDGELKRDEHGRPRRYPGWGDGTVHRGSASLIRRAVPVHAQHGALASGKEARRTIADFLLEDDHLGPDQADGGLGLSIPDYAVANERWHLYVTGTDDPAGVRCAIAAVDGDHKSKAPLEADSGNRLRAAVRLPAPGLYRITVDADHSLTLTQMVFAGPAGQS